MASFQVWLGIFFLVGLTVLGTVQTVKEDHAAGTGLAIAAPVQHTQQELNLCMNGCMRGCVTQPGDEAKCLEICNTECGVE